MKDEILSKSWQTELMDLLEALVDALPPQARVVVANSVPREFCLYQEETEGIDKMTSARLEEFKLGRYAARRALGALGIADKPVPKGPAREPVWPTDIVGSIAHKEHTAVAAVAHAHALSGIGIDIETDRNLDDKLIRLICRPDERERLARENEAGRLAMVIFSAKEAVYKCIWPRLGRYVDFRDIEIALDTEAGRFAAIAHQKSLPKQLVSAVCGRYFQHSGMIATTAHMLA